MEIEVKDRTDTIKVQQALITIMPDLDAGKTYDVIIKRHREKRSKNANDYSWVLQDKIAKATGKSIEEIHEQMVLDYGVTETYSIKKCAFNSAKRVFDYFKVLGESTANNNEFVHVRVGIGTHLYDTKEMNDFINGVVQEAENLGIETRTPDEIAEMLSLWEQGKR